MRVLVVGSTGVIGRHAIPRLIERGHQVRAVARHAEQVDRLRRLGVEGFVGDILDPDSLLAPADGVDAILHLATSIPSRDGSRGSWELNDRIRREGTRNLLLAAERGGARRYVQQSITFLYGDAEGLIDEDHPLRPETLVQSAADMEELVRAAPLDWSILRGGVLYGPGTGQDEYRSVAARGGTLAMPGDGTDIWSLTHVADFAAAFVQAAESAPARCVFNVVDDTPVTVRDLFQHITTLFGGTLQPGASKLFPSIAVDNRRIKEALGWMPAYASYRSGWAG
jgi:nucleoside-diphosphate-sugar epimerase